MPILRVGEKTIKLCHYDGKPCGFESCAEVKSRGRSFHYSWMCKRYIEQVIEEEGEVLTLLDYIAKKEEGFE